MADKRVVVIPGEDAGPEVVEPTVALLDRLGLDIEWLYPDVAPQGAGGGGLGALPDPARNAIDTSDAALFGATNGPSAAALMYLRWGRETYANLRPIRWFPGCRSPLADPGGIDFVIVRENLEDLYLGIEGDAAELSSLGLRSRTAGRRLEELGPGRFALKVMTEKGCERIARFAFELAQRRRQAGHPGKVTCSSKYNMLRQTDGYFLEIARGVATEFPEIRFEQYIVDDFARRMVAEPAALDVVLLPNLYGDVLSDLGAGVIGGLGLAPSGCFGDGYAYFESAHGSAPDIAGQDRINPTATLLSARMLLEYLGFAAEARRLEGAIQRLYADGTHLTRDQGGTAGTAAFCAELARLLELTD